MAAKPQPVNENLFELRDPIPIDDSSTKTDYIVNNNTLYIKCGELTENQVRQAISVYVSMAKIYTKKEFDHIEECKFRINIPRGKEGNTFGIAYVWLTSPVIYNVLIGKEPDGSKRQEKINIPPVEENTSQLESFDPTSVDFSKGFNWADMLCEDLESSQKEYRDLPPAVKRIFYYYDKSQREEIQKRTDSKIESLGTYVDILPSIAEDVRDNLSRHTLSICGLKPWITEKMVRLNFLPYVTKTSEDSRIKYPTVKISNTKRGRAALIGFYPGSYDAVFALQMTRRFVFESGTKTQEVIVSHAPKYLVSNKSPYPCVTRPNRGKARGRGRGRGQRRR